MRALVALLLIGCAPISAAWADEPATVDHTTAADSLLLEGKARELLELMAPPEEAARNLVANYLAAYDAFLKSDQTISGLEARKKGLRSFVLTRISSEIRGHARDETTRSADAVSKIYLHAMTEQEIDTAIAFYRSPVGIRMTQKMVAASKAAYHETVANPSAQDTESMVSTMTKSAGMAAFDAIRVEDGPAVSEFMKSSAYLKMQMAGPEIQAAVKRELLLTQKRISDEINPMISKTINEYFSKP